MPFAVVPVTRPFWVMAIGAALAVPAKAATEQSAANPYRILVIIAFPHASAAAC